MFVLGLRMTKNSPEKELDCKYLGHPAGAMDKDEDSRPHRDLNPVVSGGTLLHYRNQPMCVKPGFI